MLHAPSLPIGAFLCEQERQEFTISSGGVGHPENPRAGMAAREPLRI
jgi:hypothetical protein